MIGQPSLWGLAVAGEAGIRHAIATLAAVPDEAMALAGLCDLREVTPIS